MITDPQPIFMDRTKYLETWMKGIKYQKLSYIDDVCNRFLLPDFSVCGDARSLFIKSDMLIWILLYNNLFKNATFLLPTYQNYLK